MKIEFIPIELVDDYANNHNTHPPEQIHQLKALFIEFGYTTPALLKPDDERYSLIAGHGRKEALEELYSEGKVLTMSDGTPIPVGTMPSIMAEGWTENQIRAYVMADNQVARNSIFDMDMVAQEIKILEDADYDIDLLGFDGLDDDGLGWEADESKISDDFHLDGIEAQVTIICSQEEKDRIQQLCSKAIIEEGITDFEFKT